jgi:hypothetical protein
VVSLIRPGLSSTIAISSFFFLAKILSSIM